MKASKTIPIHDQEDGLVARGLGRLRRPAPPDLASAVLGTLGLADSYVQVDGPIGPLLVAFGKHGISLVERAADAGDFEAEFQATFGRPVRRVERAPELIQKMIDARLWGRVQAADQGAAGPGAIARVRAQRAAQGARDPAR